MSDRRDSKTGDSNVIRDFGVNVGNIANVKAISSASGLSIANLDKIKTVEVAVEVPDPWISVTSFSNGWVNYGGSSPTMKFMKHPDGTVELKGAIKNGTIGLTCTTLPVGYRPDSERMFATVSNSAFGAVRILSTGDVIPFVGSNVWFYTNLTFLASDSRPQVLPCFPFQIKTDLRRTPAGIIVLGTSFAEQRRTPEKLPGAAPNHVDWSFVRKHDGNYIQIENITGLPYNQKTKVKLMIVGT